MNQVFVWPTTRGQSGEPLQCVCVWDVHMWVSRVFKKGQSVYDKWRPQFQGEWNWLPLPSNEEQVWFSNFFNLRISSFPVFETGSEGGWNSNSKVSCVFSSVTMCLTFSWCELISSSHFCLWQLSLRLQCNTIYHYNNNRNRITIYKISFVCITVVTVQLQCKTSNLVNLSLFQWQICFFLL